jgi:hypothetical protein
MVAQDYRTDTTQETERLYRIAELSNVIAIRFQCISLDKPVGTDCGRSQYRGCSDHAFLRAFAWIVVTERVTTRLIHSQCEAHSPSVSAMRSQTNQESELLLVVDVSALSEARVQKKKSTRARCSGARSIKP